MSDLETRNTRRRALSNARYSALGLDFTGAASHFSVWYHPPAMPLKTNGFESVRKLRLHFGEHGGDFGASNANEYEEWADNFLSGPCPSGMHECTRRCGFIIRYDPSTEAYGIIRGDGVILTFYVPVPCSSVPFHERELQKKSGRCHDQPNNLLYWKRECEK
jgi:hypothetical protein